MNLENYIRGQRKGREINRLEREAMRDSFLSDALKGYDSVKGGHEKRIEEMQSRISQRTRRVHYPLRSWSIAATILLVIGIGGYFLWEKSSFLLNKQTPNLTAENTIADKKADEIQIPEETASAFEFEKMDSAKINSEALIAQNKQSEVHFVPPVIMKDEDVRDERMEMQAELAAIAEKINQKEIAPVSPLLVDTDESMLIALRDEEKALDEVAVVKIKKYKDFNDYKKQVMIPPVDSSGKKIAGEVSLSFSVDENGHPYNVTIKKSVSSQADAEAIRLIRGFPDWKKSDKDVEMKIKF
ncbi:hypothetical protein FACS189426_22720 [Bacteroidia bacterium]|nr:hypothetical protein FACS189426_22720 [Bacteroidia bacterium]GHT84698.1 hypothetical protein FACS18947_2530 [Bacteroidia bacterium]